MRKIFLILAVMMIGFLVVGAGCSKNETDDESDSSGEFIEDKADADDIDASSVGESESVLVNRTRYVRAGNAPFDFTNVIFVQKKNSGYKIEVSSDRDLKIEVMTDKDCLLKAQGNEYKIIEKDEGKDVIIVGEKLEGDNRNLCVGATALGSGQVEVKFKVIELI